MTNCSGSTEDGGKEWNSKKGWGHKESGAHKGVTTWKPTGPAAIHGEHTRTGALMPCHVKTVDTILTQLTNMEYFTCASSSFKTLPWLLWRKVSQSSEFVPFITYCSFGSYMLALPEWPLKAPVYPALSCSSSSRELPWRCPSICLSSMPVYPLTKKEVNLSKHTKNQNHNWLILLIYFKQMALLYCVLCVKIIYHTFMIYWLQYTNFAICLK